MSGSVVVPVGVITRLMDMAVNMDMILFTSVDMAMFDPVER